MKVANSDDFIGAERGQRIVHTTPRCEECEHPADWWMRYKYTEEMAKKKGAPTLIRALCNSCITDLSEEEDDDVQPVYIARALQVLGYLVVLAIFIYLIYYGGN